MPKNFVDICSFTLDEFAQSIHGKDSLLLGKIHVALLEFLISDVEAEICNGYFAPHLNISCNFLALLHSVFIKQCSVDVNVDAEICCGTRECDLKDWSFKYFSLQHRNKLLWIMSRNSVMRLLSFYCEVLLSIWPVGKIWKLVFKNLSPCGGRNIYSESNKLIKSIQVFLNAFNELR
nr:homeobox-ddt domain protein rlt3 [Quercus suber]